MSDAEKHEQELKQTTTWLAIAFACGLGLIAVRYLLPYFASGFANGWWRAYGYALVAMLWALAYFGGGFLIGFLFGIPKTLTPAQVVATNGAAAPGPATNGDGSVALVRAPGLKPNSNLEDVSDWLTKTLVGATLTQLGKLPGFVRSSAEYAARGIGGPSQETTLAAVIVYFSALGFLTGYVLTRMFFSEAFARSDRGVNVPSAIDVGILGRFSANLASLDEGVQPDAATERAALRMQDVRLSSSLSSEQALAVANGALLTQDNRRAVSAARMAANSPGASAEAQLAFAFALFQSRAHPSTVSDQLERAHAALRAAPQNERTEDFYNSLLYIALYLDPPAGFRKGIELGAEFFQVKPEGPTKKSLWTNLACAYGQEFSFLQRQLNGADEVATAAIQAKLVSATDNVILCIRGALKADPQAIIRLRELATNNGTDQDLVDVARSNATVRDLLGIRTA